MLKKSTVAGYGVFALEDIKKGEIIEQCPVLLFDEKFTGIEDYIFIWDKDNNIDALPMGYGCYYNHSNYPNANYKRDKKHNLLNIIAIAAIKADQEIFISYGKPYFKSRDIEMKMPAMSWWRRLFC